MFKLNKKFKLTTLVSLCTVAPLIAIPVLLNTKVVKDINNKKQINSIINYSFKEENDIVYNTNKLVVITQDMISSKSNNEQSYKKLGIKRFDILLDKQLFDDNEEFKKTANELVSFLNKQLNNNNLLYSIQEFTSIISISTINDSQEDWNAINDWVSSLIDNNQYIKKIYKFDLKTNFQEFINKSDEYLKRRNNFVAATEYKGSNPNEWIYKYINLPSDEREKHFYNNLNNKILVGILEAGGVIDENYVGFRWNNKYGNYAYWRNEPFYYEKYSDHANQVGEIIVGKYGVNQTVTLWSVQLDTFWNGLSGELNFFLSRGVNIINNSWGNDYLLEYNWMSEYFDDIINNNPELINIVSAGNEGDVDDNIEDETPNPQYTKLRGPAYSKNSIIVGAYNLITKEMESFSSSSNSKNYITTSAPDNFKFSGYPYINEEGGVNGTGTSFSAPLITSIATILKQKYPNQFNKGYDSIIYKSALISGSKSINNNLYDEKAGYGIVDYLLVSESLKNLVYFKTLQSKTINHYAYFNKGDKIRANISWLTSDILQNKEDDIDLIVYDQNGKQVTSSKSSNRNTETVEFSVSESGWYRFEIEMYLKRSKHNKDVALTYVKK